MRDDNSARPRRLTTAPPCYTERARGLARACFAAALLASVIASPAFVQTHVSARRQEAAETIHVPSLIREVALRERANNRDFAEYTYTSRVTEREVKGGRVVKESVVVSEVYPQFGEAVKKVLSRDGVDVPAAEAEREFRRVLKELEKAEREAQKRREQAARQAADDPPPAAPDPAAVVYFGPNWAFRFRDGFRSGEFVVSIWHFLRAGEFYGPQRVELRGRAAILLRFRPRPDFVPPRDSQKPYARLAGRVWIDADDYNVIRLEAWPAPGAAAQAKGGAGGQGKAGAATQGKDGAAASWATGPGNPAVILEQTRLPDGRWKESLVRLNTHADRELFNGVARDWTEEMSDFRRFTTKTGDAAVEAPKPPPS